MRPASEILNVGLGRKTTMRIEYLKNASREGGSRIPVSWSSNLCFEELRDEGLVIEGHDVTPGWQRQWLITDAGRAVLAVPPAENKNP